MKQFATILTVILFSWELHAQNFYIQKLTNYDGLSNSSVNTIFQDSLNQMWFGTWDGLNCYNGKDFEVYKPEINNPNSISNNIIRGILEERDGIEWIATDLGINRFDTHTKKIQRYFFDTGNRGITNEHSFLIAKNKSNIIFAVVNRQGIFCFDKKAQKFVKINININLNIKKIFFDSNDNLWIYNDEKKLNKLIIKQKKLLNVLIDNCIINYALKFESVFYDHRTNRIWLINTNRQYVVYDISKNSFSVVSSIPSIIGTVQDVVFNKNIQLLGSSNGLYSYDEISKKFKVIVPNISVLSLYNGTQNIVWVGTDMQGVWQLSPSQNNFRTYPSENSNLFNHNAVRTFFEDNQNNLWVGTKGGGIYVFSKNKNNEHLSDIIRRYNTRTGLLSNSVYTIIRGFNNEIWIGTDGRGINYYDPQSKKIRNLAIDNSLKNKINLSSIYSILPYKNNILFVGTSGYGMYKLKIDYSTEPYSIKSYKQYVYQNNKSSLSNNIVFSIIQDDNSHLWIGTRGGGLNRFDIDNETFQIFHLSSGKENMTSGDDILCLYKDSKGYLWSGTSMGLNKLTDFNDKKPVFVHYSEEEGMPNNTIHGILEDAQNNIWLSTNKGIAKLVQTSSSYRIVSYFKKDGLQNNEFSDGAFYQSPYSKLFYFGGIDGFNVFNPLEIVYDAYMPKIVMNAFYVDNKETNLCDFLQEKNRKETLILSNKNNSFSFKFTPIDYISSNKCEIAYYLKGYQKDWIQLGTSNNIVFSNIPPGNYTLKVRCSNADKIWSNDIYTLPIKILPPWYATIYAFCGYFILLALIAFGVIRFLKYQIAVKRSIRQKELEKQKMEEIHQEKLSFFTNIAHEFSNSLTLIYGPSEQLLRNRNVAALTKKYLNIIKSNSERMQTLIQQLIDFRKVENGHLKLSIEPVDIVELVKFEVDNFLIVLEEKHINLKMNFLPETISWNTDRDSMEKIIFNLISNAAKYTPENETITILFELNNNHLIAKITNSGIGIEKKYQRTIFDRFEVLNRFEKEVSKGLKTGNGIGLALCKSLTELLHGTICIESDEKTYTSFIIDLPEIPCDSASNNSLQNKYKTIENKNSSDNNDRIETEDSSTNLLSKNKKEGIALVIDDEQEICQFIYDILNKKFDIELAFNGKEALEIVSKCTPTIVICDVIMPVMNGIEFVKTMKENELTRHIPIILLSTKSSIENQIEGLETGADGYLGKPFHPRHLEAMIESLVHRDKALLDYRESPYSAMEQFEGKLIKKEDKQLITAITEIIYSNIDNDRLSIDLIAAETALSKMQLYRKIKELLNLTPTEYIRSIRLMYAENLLKTTHKTVQEIMYSCGFNNKAYFYREFSKKYHLTPKEYRNNNQGN